MPVHVKILSGEQARVAHILNVELVMFHLEFCM